METIFLIMYFLTVYVFETTSFARSSRRFFVYHQAMKPPHTDMILSSFSILLVLKCAAKILKIG